MCGRFNLVGPGNLQVRFATQNELPGLPPRANIAPTQQVVIATCERELRLARWELVPHWAKDASSRPKMINARAESVATKPSFRRLFRSRRCLIPATGFYEWLATPAGKTPYNFRLLSGDVFGMAGLCDTWTNDAGDEVQSCAIITTEANELVGPVHTRMPVILRREDEGIWLDPDVTEAERLQALLHPYAASEMEAYPVSTALNRPTKDGADAFEPVCELAAA